MLFFSFVLREVCAFFLCALSAIENFKQDEEGRAPATCQVRYHLQRTKNATNKIQNKTNCKKIRTLLKKGAPPKKTDITCTHHLPPPQLSCPLWLKTKRSQRKAVIRRSSIHALFLSFYYCFLDSYHFVYLSAVDVISTNVCPWQRKVCPVSHGFFLVTAPHRWSLESTPAPFYCGRCACAPLLTRGRTCFHRFNTGVIQRRAKTTG